MPALLEKMISESLISVGLTTKLIEDAILLSPVKFEGGRTLHFMFMVISERRWLIFRRLRLSVSLSQLGDGYAIKERFVRDWISLPNGSTDLLFRMQLIAMTRSMALGSAHVAGLGDCIGMMGEPKV